MQDRTFIAAAAAALVVCVVAILVAVVPMVPDDGTATATPLGRMVQLAAFAFGMMGALSATAQVRRMYETRSSTDVSTGFLFTLGGSFVTWLSYGVVLLDWVMLAVNTVGVTVVGTAWLYALRLRGASDEQHRPLERLAEQDVQPQGEGGST